MVKKTAILIVIVGLITATVFLVAVAPYHIYTLTLTEGVSTRFLEMRPSSKVLYDGNELILKKIVDPADTEFFTRFHFSQFEMSLPFNHPLYTMVPVIKLDSEVPRLGASYFDGKHGELFSFSIEKMAKLETTSGQQKLFSLPYFKNYIAKKSESEFWQDLFYKKLSLPTNAEENFFSTLVKLKKVSYSELVYNLYILYNRALFFPANTKKISFDRLSNHGLIEISSDNSLFISERLYLIEKGIIYSLNLKTKRGHMLAEKLRNKMIQETIYKNSTPDSAIAIYAKYKNISYEKRIDQEGMTYLYMAWSHDLMNREFIRVIILFLERGKSNLKYLKPFYEYAYKRFGTSLSSDSELLMESTNEKLKREMKQELESEIKNETEPGHSRFEGSVLDPAEKIKMNLQKAKEHKNNSDDSEKILLQE